MAMYFKVFNRLGTILPASTSSPLLMPSSSPQNDKHPELFFPGTKQA
jgi:hypothetical protein